MKEITLQTARSEEEEEEVFQGTEVEIVWSVLEHFVKDCTPLGGDHIGVEGRQREGKSSRDKVI